ncbi:MAG: hypothetical protein ACYC5A_02030 [Thermoleophilia bacterium]
MRKQNEKISLAAVIVGALAMLSLLLAGCGEDAEKGETTAAVTIAPPTTTMQQAPACEDGSPSVIPAASGLPRHIYFYRDT